MDQDKVNPFVGNTETPAGGTPVSATPTASVDSAVSAPDPVNPYVSAVPPTEANSATPVNPYAPAGAPYAPGSNTPAPSYADPISPAVPNTSAPDPAYTSFSPAPSQDFIPMNTPERPKLFTKKFVIFAVIGLVLIAGAVVAGLVLQGSRSGSGGLSNTNTGTSSGSVEYIKSFYRFSNYVINGSDSTAALKGNYTGSMDYSLAKATLGQEDNVYLVKMKELFDQFVVQYEKARSISLEKLISEVNSSDSGEVVDQNIGYNAVDYNIANLYRRVNFLEEMEKAKISEENIVKTYMTNGTTSVENLFDSTYDHLKNATYPGGAEYAEKKIEYGSYLAKLLEIYNNAGCLKDGYNQKCAAEIPLDQNGQNIYESVEQLQSEAEAFESEVVFYIVNACWDIQGVFTSGGEEI